MPLAMTAAAGGGSRKCAADSQKASIPLEPMLLKAKQFLFSRVGQESKLMGKMECFREMA